MTALAGAVISERWLDEIIIGVDNTNVDGDLTDTISLPAGLGDVAVMEIMVEAQGITNFLTTPELSGLRVSVDSNLNGYIVDIIGTSHRWSQNGAARLVMYISPDPLVLWRQNEVLHFVGQELDDDATPTVDLVYRIKCVRVREVRHQEQPLFLVRPREDDRLIVHEPFVPYAPD